MKFIFTILLVISGSFALAEPDSRSPWPPAQNIIEQLQNPLSFIRTCGYLFVSGKGANPESCDKGLDEARAILHVEMKKLILAFSNQIQNPPTFKYLNLGSKSSDQFKWAWTSYFGAHLNSGREIIEATAGFPKTEALEELYETYFTLAYEAAALLSRVKIHLNQPKWIEKFQPYPRVFPMIHPHELMTTYNNLHHIQPADNGMIERAHIRSMKTFLKAYKNKGFETFEPDNFWQFVALMNFWETKEMPVTEVRHLQKIKDFETFSNYRSDMQHAIYCEMIMSGKIRREPNAEF